MELNSDDKLVGYSEIEKSVGHGKGSYSNRNKSAVPSFITFQLFTPILPYVMFSSFVLLLALAASEMLLGFSVEVCSRRYEDAGKPRPRYSEWGQRDDWHQEIISSTCCSSSAEATTNKSTYLELRECSPTSSALRRLREPIHSLL